jgi:hypothetical protein
MRSEIRAQQRAEQRRRRFAVVGPMLGLLLVVGGCLALWSMGESGRDRVVLSSVEPDGSGASTSTSTGPGAAEPWFVPAVPGASTTSTVTTTSVSGGVPSAGATSRLPAGTAASTSTAVSTSPSASTTTKRKGPPKPPGPPTSKDK